jgi:hypothetical protein
VIDLMPGRPLTDVSEKNIASFFGEPEQENQKAIVKAGGKCIFVL